MAKDTDGSTTDESLPTEDTSQRNIAESADIILKLRATAETSKRIMRQVRFSFETQKMVESSKQMNAHCKGQILRAKRRK